MRRYVHPAGGPAQIAPLWYASLGKFGYPFNLVYHDSLLQPWDMGEDGGWGIPHGDAGRLQCLLNAGLPYVYPGATDKQISQVLEAAELARRCGMMEMISHEFLDETRRLQRTTFRDGTTVTANFDTQEYSIFYSATR